VITSYGGRDKGPAKALRQVTWHRGDLRRGSEHQERRHPPGAGGRSLPAVSRIALTGTPVENRLADLWSIMEFTSSGLLGPAEKIP